MKGTAGSFIRDFDTHDFINKFIALDLFDIDDARIAHKAHDGLAGTFTDVNLQPFCFEAVNQWFYFFFCRICFQHNNHCRVSSLSNKKKQAPMSLLQKAFISRLSLVPFLSG